ncbi:MAG: hypothetical protein D6705_01975 [Deltaproteobacteria bacterium]|nr:MAG: hypothetical protein D6705_01975 [Deltaproteobacteria bacterium]
MKTMQFHSVSLTIAALLAAAGGCQTDGTSSPAHTAFRSGQPEDDASVETVTLRVSLPAGTDPAAIEAIAKAAEAAGGDGVTGARVAARAEDGTPLALEIVLVGPKIPDDQALEAAISPHLPAQAPVSIERRAGAAPDLPAVDPGLAADPDATPEEIRDDLEARIRDAHPDAEVEVAVDEDGDERRVEVRVHAESETP